MFEFDKEAALEGAKTGGSYINESGVYKGKLTKVYAFESKSGTKGIGFEFESDDGQKANFDLYYKKANGEQIFGYNRVQSIMAVTKTRSFGERVDCTVTRFKKEADVKCFPAIEGKKIQIAFQKTLVTGVDGGEYENLDYVASFNYDTGQAADEQLEDKPAKRIESVKAMLERNPVKDKRKPVSIPKTAGVTDDDDGFPFEDDDVPF